MCKFNFICQVKDGSCGCDKLRPVQEIIKPIPFPLTPRSEQSLMFNLFQIIMQQNEMIKSISEQTRNAIEKIGKIAQQGDKNNITECFESTEEITTPEKLEKLLCGEHTNRQYYLQILSDIPNPAYKERSFFLMIQIFDCNGNKAKLPEIASFELMLFTNESPPKIIKINTCGDKIMRGTIEAQGVSTVFFRKVVIKEVSSHFRNGSFYFVINPKNCNVIKPLIVENFVIKARKITNDGIPTKKNKIYSVSE